MSDILALALAFFAGALLGVFFFGGLWWTVQKGVTSETPALWFLGSLLLRTGLVLAGFYLAAQGHWSRLAVCLLGFLIARLIVVRRLTRAPAEEPTQLEEETNIALSPDDLVFWRYGFVELNSTIVTTWVLMLVMTVGSWLITRKLVTEVHISRWQGFLEIVVTNIQEQIEEVGLRQSGEISGFSGDLVPVHRGVQPLCDHPGIRCTDGFALDHVGAGDLGVRRGADLRHRGARVGRLLEVLPEADVDHVAV